MEKKPLSEEQVEEIINALENDEFEDNAEFSELSGEGKTTYVDLEIDLDNKIKMVWGYLNDDCKSSLPSPIYQHSLQVFNYVFTGEETEYDNCVDWELETDKYKMPEDQELLEKLVEALEEHKEECNFEYNTYLIEDIYDEWDEDELRIEIEEKLEGENFVIIDDELYTFDDDINELLEELGLDEDYDYEFLDYDQAVQFLLDSEIECVD